MVTEHTKEFYLAKAEENPLLEDAIAGTATFTQHLEGIVEKLHRGKESMAEGTTGCYELRDYIAMLSALLPESTPRKEEIHKMNYSALTMGLHKYFRRVTLVSGIVTGLGALLLTALNPAGVVLALAGTASGALWGPGFFQSRKFNKEAQQIFQCLYDASAGLDEDIGRCFILEHFTDARPRFEQTYAGMSGNERDAADELLYGYLAAGGMPSMDENQLKGYLSGLLKPEVKGDA